MPVTIGASVGAMSMRSGVFGGSCANSGTSSESSVDVIGSGGAPPGPSRSIVVSERAHEAALGLPAQQLVERRRSRCAMPSP